MEDRDVPQAHRQVRDHTHTPSSSRNDASCATGKPAWGGWLSKCNAAVACAASSKRIFRLFFSPQVGLAIHGCLTRTNRPRMCCAPEGVCTTSCTATRRTTVQRLVMAPWNRSMGASSTRYDEAMHVTTFVASSNDRCNISPCFQVYRRERRRLVWISVITLCRT